MIIFDFWFITFSVIFLVVGVVASEMENFALGTATFVAGLLSLQWLFGVPVWESILANPLKVVVYLAIYTVIGALYTLLWRWPEFLRDNAKNITEGYSSYTRLYSDATPTAFFASTHYPYKAKSCKNEIATWILTWPFSGSWELARKPIKYVYAVTYSILGEAFERVGTSVSKRILNK